MSTLVSSGMFTCHSHAIACDGCRDIIPIDVRFCQIHVRSHNTVLNMCSSCSEGWLKVLSAEYDPQPSIAEK